MFFHLLHHKQHQSGTRIKFWRKQVWYHTFCVNITNAIYKCKPLSLTWNMPSRSAYDCKYANIIDVRMNHTKEWLKLPASEWMFDWQILKRSSNADWRWRSMSSLANWISSLVGTCHLECTTCSSLEEALVLIHSSKAGAAGWRDKHLTRIETFCYMKRQKPHTSRCWWQAFLSYYALVLIHRIVKNKTSKERSKKMIPSSINLKEPIKSSDKRDKVYITKMAHIGQIWLQRCLVRK